MAVNPLSWLMDGGTPRTAVQATQYLTWRMARRVIAAQGGVAWTGGRDGGKGDQDRRRQWSQGEGLGDESNDSDLLPPLTFA